METNLAVGMGFVILCAICNGAFAFPPKFVKEFAWENTWGTFWFLAMVVIPAIVIPLLIRDLDQIWAMAGARSVAMAILFGMLWGFGCLTFGVGIDALGLSLGFSIIMGVNIGLGALAPLIAQNANYLGTFGGNVVTLGVATCILGTALCGRAGMVKEHHIDKLTDNGKQTPTKPVTRFGIFMCVLSGILSACMNLGYSFANTITNIAHTQFGNASWAAGLAAWMLLFWGGFVVTGAFAAFRLTQNGTWRNYRNQFIVRNISLTACMAVLQFAIFLFYGAAAFYLGDLGTTVGFAASISISIVLANILGFATAEWKGAGRESLTWMMSGLGVMVAGVCLLAWGNALLSKNIT